MPKLPRMDDQARAKLVAMLDREELSLLRWHWRVWARPGQLPPPGDWRVWLILAGRGFGKTRAGAEWVRSIARNDPMARIALVGASLVEARSVMVEGESGLLHIGPPDRRPHYEPSLRRLTWPNGAQALLYGAGEPDALRGPQHSHAWCDELAKWHAGPGLDAQTWDNLLMGLRLGENPQVVATTTPRPVPLLTRLMEGAKDGSTVITRGTSQANAANLPPQFLAEMQRLYGESALGRQELGGEMIADMEGALWTRAMIEAARETMPPEMARVVIGVDPPASATGDQCGIVVCGRGADGIGRVLADCSVAKPSPERWARAVADAAAAWNADRIVAEANQGGDMVASVLRAANTALPVRLVHASRGKAARAEPVAALYEAGRVRHAGLFPALEDELCGIMPGGDYRGPGRSPDRADACVWALSALMLGQAGEPRVRWN